MLLLRLSPIVSPPINHPHSTRTKSILRPQAMVKQSSGSSPLEHTENNRLGACPRLGGLVSVVALEGLSCLVSRGGGDCGVVLYTMSKTGSGLPNGPFGLLGAVEGLSYLSSLAIIISFGCNFFHRDPYPARYLVINAPVEL